MSGLDWIRKQEGEKSNALTSPDPGILWYTEFT